MQLFWICLGGALGTGARYLLSTWALRAFGDSFPVGTVMVNVAGSFLLTLLMRVGIETTAMSPTMRLALTVGVMGGFTTYSTFNYETMIYLREGALGTAALNVFVTVMACLAASFVGWGAGKWIAR